MHVFDYVWCGPGVLPRLFPDLIKSSKAGAEKILCRGEKGSCWSKPSFFTWYMKPPQYCSFTQRSAAPHLLMCSPPSLHSGEEMRYRPHTAHYRLPHSGHFTHLIALHTAHFTLHLNILHIIHTLRKSSKPHSTLFSET